MRRTPKAKHEARIRRYAIYVRTAAGGDDGADKQLAALRAVIAARGDGKIVCEYVDTNVSGAGGPGPQLQALIEELPARAVNVVVVTGLGRLSRTQRTLTDVLAAIRERGARILAVETR